MTEETNYLLSIEGFPRFSRIRPEDVLPAVRELIQENRDCIRDTLARGGEKGDLTYRELTGPIDRADDRLTRMWSAVSHLNSVMDTDELRAAHDSALPDLTDFSAFVGQHRGLYEAYRKIMDSPSFKELSRAERQDVENTMRSFRLSGISLPEEGRRKYLELTQRLSELSSKFSHNVMDAVLNWHCQVTDEAELSGLPDTVRELARENARQRGLEGWVFTLDFPSYLPVMQYADSRSLRQKCYEAYVTRASDQGPDAGKWDNTPVLVEILNLRRQLAELLGFPDYAHMSLEEKMADTPEQVMSFLNDLARRARSQGEQEDRELREFAAREHGCQELKPWDRTYYAEKLKMRRFSISDEELRKYFPLSRVLEGLFETCHRLFGISVRPHGDGEDLYHPDVRLFDVLDRDGTLRGSFYLDPFARQHKRSGAWMDECIGRRREDDGSVRHPVAFVVCNFTPAAGGGEPLLTHDDVITVFHEFGHALNLLLTDVDVPGVSGISGVDWDAVELPSQFMENWCWQQEALNYISGTVDTGTPLPEDKLKMLLASRNFNSALALLRQLEFALTDFRLHLERGPVDIDLVRRIIADVRSQVAVAEVPEYNRFENSFQHIFAGGYAAGYYSYLWAELLSSDAFSRFEEEGIFSPEAGADFRNFILASGGSVPSMEQFSSFRGREPKIDALLRHRGIRG